MMRAAICMLGTLLTCSALHAQYAPFSAKAKQTEEVFVGGKLSVTQTKEGRYYRRSSGATLEEWTTFDGREAPGVAYLQDESGAVYHLSMGAGTAVARRTSPLPPPDLPTSPNDRDPIIVAGVPCVPAQTKSQPRGQPAVPLGENCFSHKYNIMLRDEQRYTGPDGKVYHTIYEATEIELFSEPDPKLFDLQARNLKIVK